MHSLQAERITILATPAARLLLAASVAMAAISCTANLAAAGNLNSDDTVQLAMHSSTVATMVFAMVAGLYSATTDHRFGLMDQRLLSQPNRWIVLRSKALAASGVGFLYGVLGAATGAATASIFYRIKGERFDLASPLVTRALLGVILAATLFAALGVAIGMIVRNQPIAIGGALAWLLMAEPSALLGLPALGSWFPGAAGLALTYSPDPDLFGQASGGILLLGYTAMAFIAANHLFGSADI